MASLFLPIARRAGRGKARVGVQGAPRPSPVRGGVGRQAGRDEAEASTQGGAEAVAGAGRRAVHGEARDGAHGSVGWRRGRHRRAGRHGAVSRGPMSERQEGNHKDGDSMVDYVISPNSRGQL